MSQAIQYSAAAQSTPAVRPGDQIGPFRILQSLGGDDIGTRYLVSKLGRSELSRTVTLILLHPSVAGDNDLQRRILSDTFQRSKVTSSNVIQTIGYGHDAFVYIVTEQIDRPSTKKLNTYVARFANTDNPLPEARWWPRMAIKFAADAARGVHAVHTCCDEIGAPLALVHGRITPENVFVDRDGVAKVGPTLSPPLTHTLMQLEGKEIQTDEPANPNQHFDVQCLGFTLWELLAETKGQPTNFRMSRDGSQTEPPLLKDLPPELTNFLIKATHRDPAKCFQTASEFEVELERVARKHRLIATAGDAARFVRRFADWELEGMTVVHGSDEHCGPYNGGESDWQDISAAVVTVESSRVAQRPPAGFRRVPPPPPRKQTSADACQGTPRPEPADSQVPAGHSEPHQRDLPTPGLPHAAPQSGTAAYHRILSRYSPTASRVAWTVAAIALLGLSFTTTTMLQLRARAAAATGAAANQVVPEVITPPNPAITSGASRPQTVGPALPNSCSGQILNSAEPAASAASADTPKQFAPVSGRTSAGNGTSPDPRSRTINKSSVQTFGISDPWKR